jgi:hypothetical protein
MITSSRNNFLATQLAQSKLYKVQKNGVIKKLSSDGKYRIVGTERHGYNVVTYKGVKLVTARALAAKAMFLKGYGTQTITNVLKQIVVARKNGISTDDKITNLQAVQAGHVARRAPARPLNRKQISKMVALFCAGYSVAQIARRFRRKVSRSHISALIRKELGIPNV